MGPQGPITEESDEMTENEFKARFVAQWLKRALSDANAAFEACKDQLRLLEDSPEDLADEEMDLQDEDG